MTDPDTSSAAHFAEAEVALSIRGLSKVFPGTRALDRVDLDLRYGEIHALCGGNGSGKSTLIKILCGTQPGDEGTVTIAGHEIAAADVEPRLSYELGVRVVHQDPPLFPDMSVAENLMLGAAYPTNALGMVHWRALHKQAAQLLERFEIAARPDAIVRELPVATRTQTVIARALQDVRDNRSIIILDEPTAALPVHEVHLLLSAVRKLAASGHAILFVSHRLDEVLSLTDRVTVLRDGKVFAEHATAELTEDELIASILGRRAAEVRSQREAGAPVGEPVLKAAGICAGPVRDVDLLVHAGEVVGIAGLLGSGRTELLSALYGQLSRSAGNVEIKGRRVNFKRPAEAIAAGVVMVPEDRARGGVFPDMSVDDNINLSVWERYWRGLGFRRSALQRDAEGVRARFRVKAASGQTAIGALSGGNQQKAVLARWLRRDPLILLLDEPTQGVDVGARADIYAVVREVADAGGCAIVVTSDLEELAQFVDRAVVLSRGRIIAEVGHDELTAHRLNQLVYSKREGQ